MASTAPRTGSPSRRRRVPFSVHAPGAREVILTGSLTRWSRDGIRLRRGPGDVWKTTLDLGPGVYEYRLIVDGEWRDDPRASRRVSNPYGGENCVLEVKETGAKRP